MRMQNVRIMVTWRVKRDIGPECTAASQLQTRAILESQVDLPGISRVRGDIQPLLIVRSHYRQELRD